jgi:hypothetical protein
MSAIAHTIPEPKPQVPPQAPEDPAVTADPDFIAWLEELL